MRISELLELEHLDEISRPDNIDLAVTRLINAGYHFVGQGFFAKVMGKESSNTVLKLFNASDKAYINFIKLVKAHTNVHFPVFRGKLMKVTDKYYAVRMERLRKNDDFRTAHRIRDYLSDPKDEHNIQKIENLDQPKLTEALDIIIEDMKLHGYVQDMGVNNICWRGDTVVIIDPYVSLDSIRSM